ncbi:MATE efflux family protein [Methylobacterium sp. 4-46]|uniref:MATE family efflux transporter n=1 Tax=unclassified Methylobacterium TaxID=2615210 RepID=UPI000152CCDA|nr:MULTISPECIES: MATE family efflux transporter [Methylobacterium]ACA17664.1 MATE efflux family protein [Methylobacterium sp. 4-46]WFT83334.1 MATE family efflux transporter [Methylobacterium nodulans]
MDASAAPAVTNRRVLALALPMTLANVTTPLLGVVGAAAIGRLGDAALLGALALGAVLFDYLFWTFGSLRMATAGLTAQAAGAGDAAEIDRALARALAVGGGVGLLLVALQRPLGEAAFALAGASPAVTAALATYFGIRIVAAPFTLMNYAVLGSTLGRGRTDLGLALQVAMNVANIALTILLVLGLGLGVAGAALAAVLAEALGFLLGLLVLRRLGSRPWRIPRAEVLERTSLLRMLAVNGDVMVRTLAVIAAFGSFSALGARAGDLTLAANAVLQNLFLVGSFFLDGFATAAEVLCGQALGARREGAFRRAVRYALGWCLGFGLAVSLLFLATGGAFIDAISTNPEVRALARLYLPFAALTPVVAAAAFAFDGIYIGATWTRPMRNLMVAALAAYLAVLGGVQGLGNTGLWLALLAFLAARGIGQGLLYPRLARAAFGPAPAGAAPAGPAQVPAQVPAA